MSTELQEAVPAVSIAGLDRRRRLGRGMSKPDKPDANKSILVFVLVRLNLLRGSDKPDGRAGARS